MLVEESYPSFLWHEPFDLYICHIFSSTKAYNVVTSRLPGGGVCRLVPEKSGTDQQLETTPKQHNNPPDRWFASDLRPRLIVMSNQYRAGHFSPPLKATYVNEKRNHQPFSF